MEMPKYTRVVLKLSGEAFAGDQRAGVDFDSVKWIAQQVADAYTLGAEMAIVVGGGNIWRGAEASRRGMDRTTADYAGMLATVI
ncbi:MAG TPA: UMP kinase, partial [Firmicutes bacterium]|nr:UMP kinase [Bacillota bacterium]